MHEGTKPAFAAEFVVEAAGTDRITVRHARLGYHWRFTVAEKNGRMQLVHETHDAPAPSEALAIDAYDAATREARRRGMVD